MMETLSRGLGEILYAEGKNVLIYLPEIGNAMLNAEDEEHLEKNAAAHSESRVGA